MDIIVNSKKLTLDRKLIPFTPRLFGFRTPLRCQGELCNKNKNNYLVLHLQRSS